MVQATEAVKLLLGIGGTLLAPGSPASERVAEAVSSAVFFTVPLALAAVVGLVVGMSSHSPRSLSDHGPRHCDAAFGG